MHIYLLRLLLIHCLWTTTTTTAAVATNDRIVRNLQRIVDTALQAESSDEVKNEDLIKQLSAILEEEEGFRVVDRPIRSVERIYDGSGDDVSDDLPPFYTNMSIITFTMVSRDLHQRAAMIVFSSNNSSLFVSGLCLCLANFSSVWNRLSTSCKENKRVRIFLSFMQERERKFQGNCCQKIKRSISQMLKLDYGCLSFSPSANARALARWINKQ